MSKKSDGLLPTPRAGESTSDNKNEWTGKYMKRPDGSKVATALTHVITYFSPPDSPANHSVMPDENEERQITATSGHRLSQSLKLSSPIGSFLKTCLESSIWYSPIVKLEWQAKALYSVLRMTKSAITTQSAEELGVTSDKQGMKQFGLLFQLAASVRPTEEIECGLLPTPTSGRADQEMSPSQLERHTLNLAQTLQMLPTPQQRDWKGQSQRGQYQEDALPNAIVFQDGQKTGMKLQPAFVEWMQGYPTGWTDLNPSETP